MPELPEVETVCRGMKSSMIGKIISLVEIKRDGLRWPFPDKMGDRITGQTVSNITRRAKYILVELDSNETIIIHLGMSGRILIKDKPTAVFLYDKKISKTFTRYKKVLFF